MIKAEDLICFLYSCERENIKENSTNRWWVVDKETIQENFHSNSEIVSHNDGYIFSSVSGLDKNGEFFSYNTLCDIKIIISNEKGIFLKYEYGDGKIVMKKFNVNV